MTDWTHKLVKTENLSVETLLKMAHPENAREHPDHQLEATEELIETIGLIDEIKVNLNTNRVINGHARIQIALQSGQASLPVNWYDLTEDEERLALEQYDATTYEATYNPDKLRALMEKTKGIKADRPALQAIMERLKAREGIDGNGAEPREPPEPQIDKATQLAEKWGTQTGQIWTLGEHRLAVGDCTDKAVVEAVMRGERGRMIFTDPPYGIGKDIENDNLKREARVEFYRRWTNIALEYIIENAYVYVWGYFDTLSDYWQEVIKPRGDCNFRNFIIWEKTFIQGRNAKEFRQFPEHYEACLLFIFGQPFQNGPWSTSPNAEYYPEMFEPLRAYLDGERQKMGWDIPTVKKMVGHSDLQRDHWFNKSQWSMPTREVYEVLKDRAGGNAFRREYDDLRREYDDLRGYFDNTNGFTDLWQFDKITIVDSHPTVKPVEVCERGIMTTSQAGEVVLDCFLGSGTTLIACEQLKRQCRAIEIDPGYCGVTLQRWADLTHQDPVLLSE